MTKFCYVDRPKNPTNHCLSRNAISNTTLGIGIAIFGHWFIESREMHDLLSQDDFQRIETAWAVRTAIFFGAFSALVAVVFYDNGRFVKLIIEALSCAL